MGGNSIHNPPSPIMHRDKQHRCDSLGMADQSSQLNQNYDESRPNLERSEGISVAFERCPLCASRNVPFYCHNCVNKGVFTHSKPKPDGTEERFVALKNKLAKHKTQNWELQQREINNERLKKALRCHEKRLELGALRARNVLLNAAVPETTEKTAKENETLKIVRMRTQKKRDRMKYWQDVHLKRLDILRKAKTKNIESQKKADLRFAEAQKGRKQLADLIIKFFGITATNSFGENPSSLMTRTSALMQDACQTAYHRGKWMFNDSNEYMRYAIAGVSVPANGNYSECLVTMAQRRENPGALPQRNAFYEAINALGYTTVLVNSLSWILDIPLPWKQSHSEFWQQTLDEKQLEKAIAKLNHNVLYLCISQGVDYAKLSPKLTLHNILRLMDMPELGRYQGFEAVDEMLLSLGDSVSGDDSEADTEEERGSVGTMDEEEDWSIVPTDAAVPVELQQLPMGMQPPAGLVSSMAQSAHAAQAALVSSVTGVFRWFDGRGRTDSS